MLSAAAFVDYERLSDEFHAWVDDTIVTTALRVYPVVKRTLRPGRGRCASSASLRLFIRHDDASWNRTWEEYELSAAV